MVNKETARLLKLFGEYDRVIELIAEEIQKGELHGCFGVEIRKSDYDVLTEEMERVFDNDNVRTITIEWCLDIE